MAASTWGSCFGVVISAFDISCPLWGVHEYSILSKPRGELDTFLDSLFGSYEKFELFITWWLENRV